MEFLGTANGSPAEFAALIDHVENTNWRPVIDSEFALDDVANAHVRLESPERFGKVVVATSV